MMPWDYVRNSVCSMGGFILNPGMKTTLDRQNPYSVGMICLLWFQQSVTQAKTLRLEYANSLGSAILEVPARYLFQLWNVTGRLLQSTTDVSHSTGLE